MLLVLACHAYAMSAASLASSMRYSRALAELHLFGDCDGMKSAKI